MKVRVVKINLRELVGEFIFAYSSKDSEMIKELESRFETFFNDQRDTIKKATLNFLLKYKIVKENKLLFNYFKNFTI